MKENITAMYARKNFGRLLDKAALLGDSYVIERAGRPMAVLVSVDQLEELQAGGKEVEEALEKLIKKIKNPKSKKLEKAIVEAREAAAKLLL
ncbi:MAG: type II toxin-antitoxin system Phd/YefM family antitoxin [Thermodesulfobacteriota bacterium]|nr:type II toxin-antitoxin system Phd/YefM family antitoxin [Thermodesulfobacteriota bacterium]